MSDRERVVLKALMVGDLDLARTVNETVTEDGDGE